MKLEDLEANRAENAPVVEQQPAAASTPAPAAKPARRPLPDHLPRQIETHPPAEQACPQCGGMLAKLGEDVS